MVQVRTERLVKSAQERLKAETEGERQHGPFETKLLTLVAVGWALYQLALPSVLIVDQTTERAIHLAFAIAILFLVKPFSRSARFPKWFSTTKGIATADYLLAIVGVIAARCPSFSQLPSHCSTLAELQHFLASTKSISTISLFSVWLCMPWPFQSKRCASSSLTRLPVDGSTPPPE